MPTSPSWSDGPRAYAGESADPRVHAIEPTSTERTGRSPAFVAIVVLACLFVAFVAVAAILSSLHNPTTSAAGHPRAAPTPVASSRAVSRMEVATDSADAATSTTRLQLDDISGIPTLTNVSPLINPYVTSLQLYSDVLARTSVPAAARTTAASARALVNRDVRFLTTINGLPSLRLGAYLEEFGRNSTELQTTLGKLQAELHAAIT